MLDIYYLSEYGKLCETMEDGIYKQFSFKTDSGHILNTFIKRPVPWIVKGIQYFDIITPYGYGGPIILDCSDRDTLKREYLAAFSEYCEQEKIVSEFIRFHPIYQNYKDVDNSFEVEFSRRTVGTNLKDYEDPVQKEFAKSLRRDNRRAIEKGVTVSLHFKPKELDVFRELYEETMDRNQADEIYYFNDDYYRINKLMLQLGAGGLLEAAVAEWGKEHGYRYIHHGGGRSSDPEDNLFKYKKKFGKNTEFDFYIGKKIWNDEAYQLLLDKRLEEGPIEDTCFFPVYRA